MFTKYRVLNLELCIRWRLDSLVLFLQGAVQTCTGCRGTGMQVQIQQLAPGMIQQIQTVCSECRGMREVIDPKDRCKVCQVFIAIAVSLD